MERRIIPPPADWKATTTAFAWCPYCGRAVNFVMDNRLNIARCERCGISENDFYVRQFNRIWRESELNSFLKKVKRRGKTNQ
ncbi:MAG: hypothetical protein PWP65_949 [Clostridia bacterium]|nr:hypothetical protein [Clostridia bacterium]